MSHHHSVEIMEILSQTFWTKISWKHCMYYKYTKELISRTILLSIFFLLRKFRQIQDFCCKLISRIKLVDVYLAIRYISVRPHFCRVNGHMVEPYPLHIWSIYIRWFWNGTICYISLTIKIVLKIGKNDNSKIQVDVFPKVLYEKSSFLIMFTKKCLAKGWFHGNRNFVKTKQ